MVLRRSWDISSGSGFRCLAPVLNRTSGCGMLAPFKCVVFSRTKYGFYQTVYGRIQPWSLCHLPAWTPLSPDIFQTWRAKATSIIFKGWMSLSLVFLHSVFGKKLQYRTGTDRDARFFRIWSQWTPVCGYAVRGIKNREMPDGRGDFALQDCKRPGQTAFNACEYRF